MAAWDVFKGLDNLRHALSWAVFSCSQSKETLKEVCHADTV